VRDATTVIAEGLRLTGDVAGDGNVVIHGRLEGAIHIGGELRIGPTGVAVADVVAARVRVDGRLEGRVRATQQVAIGSDGCLIGDVQGLLAVEEGGLFQGRVELDTDPAGQTIEAPPEMGMAAERRKPRRLEQPARPVSPPRLRIGAKERRLTAPSTTREEVRERSAGVGSPHRLDEQEGQVTRKMPQVRDDMMTPSSPVAVPTTSAPLTTGRARAVHRAPSSGAMRPATTGRARVVSSAPPAPRPQPPPTLTGPVRKAPPTATASQKAAALTTTAPSTGSVRVVPPSPPRRRRPEPKKPRKGDPILEREDLSDDWFEEEDYLVDGG
jgi:cytoskeletal protein CcmA (bactofilin family)